MSYLLSTADSKVWCNLIYKENLCESKILTRKLAAELTVADKNVTGKNTPDKNTSDSVMQNQGTLNSDDKLDILLSSRLL